MKKIILASGSPRRRELMAMLGYDFEVVVSDVEEIIDERLSFQDTVKSLAIRKAQAVYEKYPDCLVIGADTIVVVDDRILGKPKDQKQAKEMLQLLSDRSHNVMTAVAFISSKEQYVICDCSRVKFNEIPSDQIEAYVLTDEPYDKAGGYAIQGWAGKYIREIEGNFYTIIGLPLDIVDDYLQSYQF
ncbi:MAG: Maf family protein [Erysipelotrichaceae bacterium]